VSDSDAKTPSQADVQALLAGWWFDYDQGNVEAWPRYFTEDAHFSCRSDSQATAFEEFVTADVSGREAVLAWQQEHRSQSPYPLRHNGTNIHLASGAQGAATFRSYIFVTQIVGGGVAPLASGICLGEVRTEDGELRLKDLRLMLDFTDSQVFAKATRFAFG
jgi:SnoaL-like domain